ncbi:site-specific integrase [Rheinheimera sp.]|uniref:site-specific integrase n=1 Tax=Rheinheimera sp. TaxID=1869214 RepID=UPI004047B2F6
MDQNTPKAKLQALLQHLDGAYALNTLRAYKADMLEFIAYCHKTGDCPLPAEPKAVAEFLMQTVSQGIKSSTIRRKVSSISAIHRLSSLDDPTKHSEVKITQRKIFRQLGTRFDQAYPINRALLTRLLAACDDNLHGLRDRALLLVAYDSMRRRSELISLRIEDIEWLPEDKASILLRKSKTDQLGIGKWMHLTSETSHALHQWLVAAQINEGLIFRGVRSSGEITVGLCESRISRIYKTLSRKAGIDQSVVQSISGHSMRVGGAQDLLNSGASLLQIMVKGGWAKTDTVLRYVERTRSSTQL